jgi:universal stress protein E
MKRFKNILCVVEPESPCEYVLDRAVSLAENNQAKLTVVDVTEKVPAAVGKIKGGPSSSELQEAMVNSYAQGLASLVEPFQKRIDIETRVLMGISFLAITREVIRCGYDLIIKMPETEDWLDRLFSSDDMHLFRKCPCPVWIIKPRVKKPFRRILAAIDVGETFSSAEQQQLVTNQQILEMASSLALSDFSELHVVHVWDSIGEIAMCGPFMDTPEEKITAYTEQIRMQRKKNMEKLIDGVFQKYGEDSESYLNIQTHLIKGIARKEIPVLAKKIDADLIVMGTVARTGIHGLVMGNTAETIINQINCSVLAIKPPNFITPVTLE